MILTTIAKAELVHESDILPGLNFESINRSGRSSKDYAAPNIDDPKGLLIDHAQPSIENHQASKAPYLRKPSISCIR